MVRICNLDRHWSSDIQYSTNFLDIIKFSCRKIMVLIDFENSFTSRFSIKWDNSFQRVEDSAFWAIIEFSNGLHHIWLHLRLDFPYWKHSWRCLKITMPSPTSIVLDWTANSQWLNFRQRNCLAEIIFSPRKQSVAADASMVPVLTWRDCLRVSTGSLATRS